MIGDAITQSPSWPKKEKQYAVQTSRSTSIVTTLWDKQSHVYLSFENVHVYPRLNAINIGRHTCTVDIHYLEGIRDKFSDWNGQQRHAWIVTCRRGFELSELCFLWVQDWIQVHLISFFGVFCNFKTNHIFTILQLKVKMMWSLVEFLSMRTFYDTCYTKNECHWLSVLNIISQDIC